MIHYGLDPTWYYSSPGLSWSALIKITGIELKLLTDYDMHLFIEKSLRGGISMVLKRYVKADNKYVNSYNSSKPSNYILYLDANNLYGWAVSQYLPTGGFKWVEKINVDVENLFKISKDSNIGFIFEVDLEYPKKLHKSHNDYPLASKKLKIKKEWMSEYQLELLETDDYKMGDVTKLVSNLMNKTKYKVYYRNLHLFLSLEMKVKKIHRLLAFNQSPWMEPYTKLNTDLKKGGY